MPTSLQIQDRERADRALRRGQAKEALGLFRQLLENVKEESGHYDAWLEGALAAYLALGRTREAGCVLLGLRRFTEAQRYFPVAERPIEWALCASKLARHGEAARVLSEVGHPALAAMELEAAGAIAAARLEWERTLRDPRLSGRAYETALAHFNLGQALLRLEEKPAAARELAIAERLLEAMADEFESRGERERAFDCYAVLLRLGKDTGSFENVAEGYLNAIRLMASGDHIHAAQYYDDFLTYAIEQKEWYAAATLAREAAEHSIKSGLSYDRHYLERAAELWLETSRHNQITGGPVDLSVNALHAAIDAASSLGDFALCGRLYGELAELSLPEQRQRRYRNLARRYEDQPAVRSPAPGFPEHLRRADSYQEVWHQDLIEWELDGDPTAVLARLTVTLAERSLDARRALRALLLASDPSFSRDNVAATAEFAVALGLQQYEALLPLERLYEHPAAEVRVGVLRGVAQVWISRSFKLIRKGLADPSPAVADAALRALRGFYFVDGFDALTRFLRESTEPAVRMAALESIAKIGTPNAAMVLIEVARQETGTLRQAAEAQLAKFGGDEVSILLREARDQEVGDRRDVLDRLLRAVG